MSTEVREADGLQEQQRLAEPAAAAQERSFGSEAGLALGDIVEVQKEGVWQDEPATVIGVNEDGSFDVRMGYRGGLTWGLEPDSTGKEPDPYGSGMVFRDKAFPTEVRSGERFRSKIDKAAYSEPRCCDNSCTRALCCWYDCFR